MPAGFFRPSDARSWAVSLLILALPAPARALVSGVYDPDTGTFESIQIINETTGAFALYDRGYLGARAVVANVEAGLIWGKHETFDRSGLPGLPPSPNLSLYGTAIEGDAPALGEYDAHATAVGHALAGTGYLGNDQYSYLGLGMAPYAELWSGAVATHFEADGSFEISTGSFLTPYKAFFNGIAGRKADVINSSWGYSDPAGTEDSTRILDGLARQNPTVTFVSSAGNGGAGTVNGFGSGYNGISVGSVDAQNRPSEFSSYGPADFYNPETQTTLSQVRSTVHLAAPGENYALAAYLGATGAASGETAPDPLPTDQYFVNASGTSFSAPVVAGAVALLKDASYAGEVAGINTDLARDTRVIRSVLMAGASKNAGWDNGQAETDGVVRTTQALDLRTGAGVLNLNTSTAIYLDGTRDVTGLGGGAISPLGWDYGSVAAGGQNDYRFTEAFSEPVELTISLNWFIERAFDDTLNTASDISFVNLDLEVWELDGGVFTSRVAVSESLYNNTEFLRLQLPDAGEFGLRVIFTGLIFDLSGETIPQEDYALAWTAVPVPEPGTLVLLLPAAALLLKRLRRNPASP